MHKYTPMGDFPGGAFRERQERTFALSDPKGSSLMIPLLDKYIRNRKEKKIRTSLGSIRLSIRSIRLSFRLPHLPERRPITAIFIVW